MGMWRASVLQIVAMAVFSIIVAIIGDQLHDLDQTTLIILGLFLAIVPTALWMFYFYRQDRLEPEPKTKIAGAAWFPFHTAAQAGAVL